MKIDTGGFGTAQRQVVSTQIDRGNPAEMAEAKIQSARNTQQLQGMANQAWDRLGGQMQQVGQQMQQEIKQLAAQKSALTIQDYQLHAQGVLQDAQDRVDNGDLTSANVQKYISDKMGEFKHDDIEGLGEAGRLQLQKGLQGVDMSMGQNSTRLYKAAHKIETRTTTDAMIANNERLALNSGADLDKAAAMYDSPLFQTQAREAYGTDYGKVIANAKASIYAAGAKKLILDNSDSYSGLQAAQKELQEGGRFHGKLDPDTELSLSSQISSHMGRLEAKAAAAQNHADAVANRQLQVAIHADTKMTQRIADGQIPTAEDWAKHEQDTKGTPLAGNTATLRASMVDTQKLFSLAPAVAQQEIDRRKLELDKNGGTESDYKVIETLQRNVNQRLADVKKNPQGVGAMDSGQPLTPFTPAAMLSAPGDGGQILQQRLTNSRAISQKYGAAAGQNLLTPDELTDTKAAYKDYTTDQRIQFWRNTSASAGPEVAAQLAREIGDDTGAVQSVASLATTPAGYKTAAAVENGLKVINPTDGATKVKFQSGSDETLIADLKNEYPGISDLRARQLVTTVRAAHVGLGNDAADNVSTDTMHAVIGTPAKFSGATVIVPPGEDENIFINRLNDGVAALGGESASVRNHLDNGTYSFVSDRNGNQIVINAKTMRKVTAANGQPIVIKVN